MTTVITFLSLFCLISSVISHPLLPSYNLLTSDFTAPVSFHSAGIVSPGIISAPQPLQNQAHPAVVANAVAESQLPQELLNPFYKNPAIAAGLARASWFGDKEFPVHHREAEKIPRAKIFKLINSIQSASI